MGTVSSKIPCNRGGQNSIGQALPETFAYKIRRRERWKKPPFKRIPGHLLLIEATRFEKSEQHIH